VKYQNPDDFIVATHGPSLAIEIRENPKILNLIGIYRVNCSHLGKESDLETLGLLLKNISKYVPILIDLQ
jgi:hypothetical protein